MMTPPTMPMTIAPSVPMIVPFQRPSSTGVCCMISNALGKFHRSFVTNELIIIATRTMMTTSATHRPGWGTGRAWMMPGRSAVSVSGRGGHRHGLTAKLSIPPASTAYFLRAAS